MKQQLTILGLDIATRTGWCFMSGRRPEQIRSGTFHNANGLNVINKFTKCDKFAENLIWLFRSVGVPDYCVMEEPMSAGPAPDVLAETNMMYGTAAAVVRGFRIPYERVASQTWRKKMYGFSRNKDWQSKDWKNHAKYHCELKQLNVRNHDEAEAVMIAEYGLHTQSYKHMILEAQKNAN